MFGWCPFCAQGRDAFVAHLPQRLKEDGDVYHFLVTMGGRDMVFDPNHEGKYPGKYLAYAKLINKVQGDARVGSLGEEVKYTVVFLMCTLSTYF